MTIARTYVDTPVLMALVCPEPESERALRWLGSCQWQELLISPWTHAELAGALAVKQRLRQLSAAKAQQALEQGRSFLSNVPCADITLADFDAAAALCAPATSVDRKSVV